MRLDLLYATLTGLRCFYKNESFFVDGGIYRLCLVRYSWRASTAQTLPHCVHNLCNMASSEKDEGLSKATNDGELLVTSSLSKGEGEVIVRTVNCLYFPYTSLTMNPSSASWIHTTRLWSSKGIFISCNLALVGANIVAQGSKCYRGRPGGSQSPRGRDEHGGGPEGKHRNLDNHKSDIDEVDIGNIAHDERSEDPRAGPQLPTCHY